MAFLPLTHLKVKHHYGTITAWGFTFQQWQDFTGDLTNAQVTLREFVGTHSAALSFYRANMDPSQGSGNRVIKKGDKVRIHAENGSGTSRKMATFKVRRVSVAIDLTRPVGRQNLVTVHLRGIGVAGVGGTGGSSGVGTPEELSNVVTGAPYVINGNDFTLTRSYAWSGTAHASTSAKSEPDGVDRVNGCTNPSFETNTTSWSGGTGVTLSRITTDHFVGTACLQATRSAATTASASYTLTSLTVGQTYTVSAMVKTALSAASVAITAIGAGTSVTPNGSWTAVSQTFVATGTSQVVTFTLTNPTSTTLTFLVDAVLMEASDVADSYFDGDTTDVTATGITTPTDGTVLRTNLSTNPSFETNTTGYTAVTGATTLSRSVAGGFSGPCYCAALRTGSVTSESLSFTASGLTSGKTYTVSAYGQMVVGTAPKLQLFSASVSGTQVSLASGAWTRASVTFTATGATELITVSFTQTNSSSVAAGFDAVQIEQAAAPTAYFDGTTTDTDSRLYAWTGTTNNSTSTEAATFTEVATISDASELDQIVLTRDSNPGALAFEDPDGTIQVFDSASYRTGASSHTITSSDYSAIDQQFDMSHIVNVLTIKYLEKIKPPTTHGHNTTPTRTVEHDIVFTDAPSLAKYGPQKKTHKVHKKSDFAAYAASVFAKNADPQSVPASVTIPIITASDLLPGFEDGHYVGNKVDVVLPDGTTTYVCRVARIQHRITPTSWAVQVFLRNQDLVQSHGVGGSGGSGKTSDTSRPGLATEVGNNPDKYVLSAHIEDDIDGTGKSITAAVIRTADASSPRIELSNSTDPLFDQGGLIAFYVDPVAGWIPGSLFAGFTSGPPDIGTVTLNGPNGPGGSGAPSLGLSYATGGTGSIANLDAKTINIGASATSITVHDDLAVTGAVAATAGVTGTTIHGSATVQTDSGFFDNSLSGAGSTTTASINTSGKFIRTPSSRRYKDDIEPLTLEEARKVLDLEPVTFKLKEEADLEDRATYPGFIAEQAADVGAELWVHRDAEGQPDGFRYAELTAALLLLVQDLQHQVDELKKGKT